MPSRKSRNVGQNYRWSDVFYWILKLTQQRSGAFWILSLLLTNSWLPLTITHPLELDYCQPGYALDNRTRILTSDATAAKLASFTTILYSTQDVEENTTKKRIIKLDLYVKCSSRLVRLRYLIKNCLHVDKSSLALWCIFGGFFFYSLCTVYDCDK